MNDKEELLELAGIKLRRIRRFRGESVHKVAKNIGISGNYLSEIERGIKEPSDIVLESIANYYEVNISKMFSLYNRIAPLEKNVLLANPPFRKVVNQLFIDERLTDADKEHLYKEFLRIYEDFIKDKNDG